MNIDIARLALIIGKYVAENPEIVSKLVALTVKTVEKLYGESSARAITEEDALAEQIRIDYLS